jgi:hypothetical protein
MKSKQEDASTFSGLGNEDYCMKSLDGKIHLPKLSKPLPDSLLEVCKGSENSAYL